VVGVAAGEIEVVQHEDDRLPEPALVRVAAAADQVADGDPGRIPNSISAAAE
jgi:hypothetical protein